MSYPGVEEVAGTPVEEVAAQAVVSLEDPTAVPPPAPANPYGLTAWGAKFMRQEMDIVCPSGQKCRARKLEVEDAIALGILESLDVFTSTLMSDLDTDPQKQANKDLSVADSLKDPEKRATFFGAVNRVVSHCVLKPSIVLYDDGNLPEGTVFANDIPFPDKMHIFRSVFTDRTQMIQPFREGQEGSLAFVEEESSVPLPTE